MKNIIKKQVNIDDVISLLNDALKLDPKAITNLVGQRVVCNKKLAKHPTVQVGVVDNNYQVGLLGILNGLFGVDEKGYGAIIADFDNDDIIINFIKNKNYYGG